MDAHGCPWHFQALDSLDLDAQVTPVSLATLRFLRIFDLDSGREASWFLEVSGGFWHSALPSSFGSMQSFGVVVSYHN